MIVAWAAAWLDTALALTRTITTQTQPNTQMKWFITSWRHSITKHLRDVSFSLCLIGRTFLLVQTKFCCYLVAHRGTNLPYFSPSTSFFFVRSIETTQWMLCAPKTMRLIGEFNIAFFLVCLFLDLRLLYDALSRFYFIRFFFPWLDTTLTQIHTVWDVRCAMNEFSKTNIVVVKYTLNDATQRNLFWFVSSRYRPFVVGLCMVFRWHRFGRVSV